MRSHAAAGESSAVVNGAGGSDEQESACRKETVDNQLSNSKSALSFGQVVQRTHT
jgi:hypothetical protein